MKAVCKRAVRLLVLGWSLCLLGGCVLQDKLIFFPEKLPRDFAFQLPSNAREVFLKTEDAEEINGLFYKGRDAKKVVLFFHGNAGSLRGWKEVASDFTEKGADFLVIDYRGYGKSSGKFSEAGFYADGQAAYEYLLAQSYRPEQIVVVGRSIGSGVATDLASRRPVGGLILEAPFSSLLQLGKEKYWFLLPGLWARYRFDNFGKIAKVNAPILLLHGESDSLIPPEHSRRLLGRIKSGGKLTLIPGGDHNDLGSFPEYHEAVGEFLRQLP